MLGFKDFWLNFLGGVCFSENFKEYKAFVVSLCALLVVFYWSVFYFSGSHYFSVASIFIISFLVALVAPRMIERRSKLVKYEGFLRFHGVDERDIFLWIPASSYAWISGSAYDRKIKFLKLAARSVLLRKERILKIRNLESALASLGENVNPSLDDELSTDRGYKEREKNLVLNIMYSLIEKTIRDHAGVLLRKRRQLVYLDDYGREITSKWEREVAYFVRNILFPLDLSLVESVRDELEVNESFQLNSDVSIKEICRSWVSYVCEIICIFSDRHDPELGHTEFDLDCMTGHEYEGLVCSIFHSYGWDASVTKGSGDHGADVIAERNGIRVAAQCKLYSSPVGNKSVQEAFSAKRFYDCDFACVVTNSTFTASARQAASKLDVSLLHHSEIYEYLSECCPE